MRRTWPKPTKNDRKYTVVRTLRSLFVKYTTVITPTITTTIITVVVVVVVVGLRLLGGKTESEGRLEVRYDGVWGSVCDDGFDNVAASVVCRQLDLGY